MLSKLGSHARHNLVAYLALFVALGGTAVAAKPMVTGADVEDGSLTGGDVQNDSLTGSDILESSLGKVGDADTLDGKDSTDFVSATTLVKRSFNPAGISSRPNQCLMFSNVALPAANPGDPVFISGAYGDGVVFSASLAAGTPGSVSTNVQVCNPTDSNASFPGGIGAIKLVLIGG
jgi:hypothetical protein